MKLTLTILLTLFTLSAHSQCSDTAQGWTLDKGATYFQHTYTTPYDSATNLTKLINQIRTMSKAKNLNIFNGGLMFDIEQYNVRHTNYSTKSIFTSIMLAAPLDFAISIDVKDKSYRITIVKLINVLYTTQGRMTYDWNVRPYKRNGCIKMKGGKTFEAIRIVGYDLTALFQLKGSVKGW